MEMSVWRMEHLNSLNKSATVADEGLIPIEKIEIEPDQRFHKLQPETVERLVESIAINGQITPIVISRKQAVGGNYRLIAGHHRIEAAKRLGQTEIKASVLPYLNTDMAVLAEVDDNLVRGELTAVEKREHMKKSKEAYDSINAERFEAERKERAIYAHRIQMEQEAAAAKATEAVAIDTVEIKPASPSESLETQMTPRTDKPFRTPQWAEKMASTLGMNATRLNIMAAQAKKIPDISRIAHTSLDSDREIDALVKLNRKAPEKAEALIAKAQAAPKDATLSAVRVYAEIEKVQLNPKTERLLVTLLYHMRNSETDAGRQIVFDRVREVFEHPEGNPYDVAQRKAHDEIRGLAKGLK
jgi:ParB/RepB/Spo0J family partition protein